MDRDGRDRFGPVSRFSVADDGDVKLYAIRRGPLLVPARTPDVFVAIMRDRDDYFVIVAGRELSRAERTRRARSMTRLRGRFASGSSHRQTVTPPRGCPLGFLANAGLCRL